MADPHSDDYFARAARRLGALTDQQLAEIRHLQRVSGGKSMSQISLENAYLSSPELFSIFDEADKLRASETSVRRRRRGVPWIAIILTASATLLGGFITGLVLSPPVLPRGSGPVSPPTPSAPDATAAKPRGQADLEAGHRLLDGAVREQFRASSNPHKIDDSLRSAIESFTAACALEPNSTEAYLGRGQARLLLGDLERAEPDLRRASELAPASNRVPYELAVLHLERSLEWSGLSRDPDVSDASVAYRKLAFESFQKATERGLKGSESQLAEAATAWHVGGIESAFAKCSGAAWETSTSEILHRWRGEVLAAKGEYSAAERALTRAVELRAHYPEALLSRGLVRAKLNLHKEAAEDFTACIERRRALERAYFHRGHSYSAQGRHTSAQGDWRRCLELGSPRGERLRELMKDAEAKTKF